MNRAEAGKIIDAIFKVADYVLIFLLFGAALFVLIKIAQNMDKIPILEAIGLFIIGLIIFTIGLILSHNQDTNNNYRELKKMIEDEHKRGDQR